MDRVELADETLKPNQPVEIHRKKDEVEDQHGIEIVEITVDAEQHVADESEDA